jgi:trans-aconitate methyltransferase
MSDLHVSSTPAFNRDAAGYDTIRRGLIPCFDQFYGTALDLIDDWQPSQTLRVLDLGAGTGLFASMVLARHPTARIHLIDASDKMLDQARQRFADNAAVTYGIADMATADLTGPWDLIISALAIHHLADADKRSLFARIRTALVPGGLFVNAEQVLGPDAATEARYARLWLAQITAAGVPQAEIAKAHERMSHDRCASVEEQLAWMRAAGLAQVDCSFKSWRFAVLSGRA